MRIAVVGGTGLVGSRIVAHARLQGLDTVVVARSTGVDLLDGRGLADALARCSAVIDVSNKTTTRARAAIGFFSKTAEVLARTAERAGVHHVVTLSIVGSDRVDFGYYMGKRAQESSVRAGAVPWTIVRATQFFEFPLPLLDTLSPVAVVPKMLCRPVAADDVASILLTTALAEPLEQVVQVVGPGEEEMVDMTRKTITARRLKKVVLPIKLPGAVGKQMAKGELLPREPYTSTATTFDDYLTSL